tara:strand:- start:57 stop:500 length:444 start_codon:yes stop_codon:yes gene_type:complete
MAHVRQQIRERVVTVLTGLTTTGNNVFETRIYPLQNTALPALIVYTNSEESEPEVIGTNRLMSRNLSLTVECYVKQTSNPNDGVDTICEEVEKAIANDTTLNGLAKDCYVSSTDTEKNSEGEKPLLVTTLIFLINYYVKEQAPDVAV